MTRTPEKLIQVLESRPKAGLSMAGLDFEIAEALGLNPVWNQMKGNSRIRGWETDNADYLYESPAGSGVMIDGPHWTEEKMRPHAIRALRHVIAGRK